METSQIHNQRKKFNQCPIHISLRPSTALRMKSHFLSAASSVRFLEQQLCQATDHHHCQMEAMGSCRQTASSLGKLHFSRGQHTERFLINLLLSRLSNSSVLHSSLDSQKLSYLIRFKAILEFCFSRDN